MNEQIAIYLLCADLSGQLNRILQMKVHTLKQKGGIDIKTSSDIRKLRNDIQQVNKVANDLMPSFHTLLTEAYGCKFEFFGVEEEKKPAGVDGKEIKLTI
jgi:hypothetical protein